jgi:hypothetical protein
LKTAPLPPIRAPASWQSGWASGALPDHPDDAERSLLDPRPLERMQRAGDADPLPAEHVDAVGAEPAERVDRREQLRRGDLDPGPPALPGDQVDEVVELVDHGLRRPAHVPRPVADPQRRPQRLDARDLGDDPGEPRLGGDRDRPDRLERGRVAGLDPPRRADRPRALAGPRGARSLAHRDGSSGRSRPSLISS